MKILGVLWMSLTVLTAGELKLVSYNIHHGVGMDGELNLKRIADVIKEHQPDFVALQEVDKMASRSGKVDQAAELAKRLGMNSAFGKSMNLGSGGYGNAILSKHPILETKVHRLPGKGEPRTALEIVSQVAGKKISFISVHLAHQSEEDRLRQVRAIEKVMSSQKHPVLMLGDFNATPESKTMKLVAESWSIVSKTGVPFTYPASEPNIEIDYILFRGCSPTKVSLFVGKEQVASDHRPLFGRFSCEAFKN